MDQAVVKLLFENIISILSNEASLLSGVPDAIRDMKDELISMQSFLVDADRKGVGSVGEKTWVANVRDMAYDAEDIIDEFMYHINSQQNQGGCSWILHHIIYFPKNLWVRHQTATEIQKINGKIKGAIPQRNQRYGIDHREGTSSKDNQKWVVCHAESALFFEEDELVGIEKKRKLIMGWLMDGEPHLTVISIVGMGGSGKTTLAANTYNNEDVKKHFDCHAWITISQAYELEDILRSLIKEFHESRKEINPADLSSMSYRLLVKTLVNYLEKKRYLLVLDDVWDTNLLDEIKVSLRDSCRGSRIILTTRKDDVACHQMGGKHHIQKMELLLTEEASELFSKNAFSSRPSGSCPSEKPQRNQRYGIDHLKGTSSKDNQKWVVRHAESALFFEEDELVGIEKKRKLIMGWLMDGEPHLTVISIVGMGGSGKTTLAANTYNNEDVKKHFDCHAWTTISQAYELEDILRSLIKEFHESRKEINPTNLSSMSYKLLVKTLVNYLEKKRYLLVLDDVWDTNLLDEIKVSLRDSCRGSRIILTTRKDDVACHQMGGKHHIHEMKLLLTEEASELFCKNAFSSRPSGSCPSELKPFVQELVGKCKGLPLAIVALGRLMYSKNMSQWNEIYSSLNWSLSNNPKLEAVKSILLLSFNDLPYQLKHCFLYCSLFPEDHEIRRNRLIKLWMAEGFVEKIEGSTLEEVADSYLLELIFKNMLQVVKRNEFGRPQRCKMHDLLRELALSISVNEKFGAVHDGGEEMKECKARRISIHKTGGELKSFLGMSKLRSFLVFNKSLTTLPLGSKMLRVLDLEDTHIDELPDEVFKLFNLRYLNLRRTFLKMLPNSIGRLFNLQTLDIRDTEIRALPHGIGKLQSLRHLIMYSVTRNWKDFRYFAGMQIPPNFGRLKNLQTVGIVEAEGDFIRQIRKMEQLNSIGISNVRRGDERDLCFSIENMRHLRVLTIMVTNEGETLKMDALSSPPPNLQKLFLTGKLMKVPQWFCSLQRLTNLLLRWSRLEEDLLPHIAALPHLGHLLLTDAYVGKQLCFNVGFLKLTRLEIRNFPQLNGIIIEKGVMSNLKNLRIDSCMELKTVPKGIEYLQNLQELRLKSVSMELENRIGNEDFSKVQHIPKRYIW